VLGRNLYQTACGSERKAEAILSSLRRELAALPEARALDLLNGMLFEVYFNSAGEFRGARNLKARRLSKLLELQMVKKFAPSIAFIRRSLEPYRDSLLFLPSAEPERVIVRLSIRKSDPPTIKSLKVNGRNVLASNPDEAEHSTRLWRLSYESFTVKGLQEKLSAEWGVPQNQIDIECTPKLDARVQLRLPEGSSIVSPLKQSR
jgi:hypothetical protein